MQRAEAPKARGRSIGLVGEKSSMRKLAMVAMLMPVNCMTAEALDLSVACDSPWDDAVDQPGIFPMRIKKAGTKRVAAVTQPKEKHRVMIRMLLKTVRQLKSRIESGWIFSAM